MRNCRKTWVNTKSHSNSRCPLLCLKWFKMQEVGDSLRQYHFSTTGHWGWGAKRKLYQNYILRYLYTSLCFTHSLTQSLTSLATALIKLASIGWVAACDTWKWVWRRVGSERMRNSWGLKRGFHHRHHHHHHSQLRPCPIAEWSRAVSMTGFISC